MNPRLSIPARTAARPRRSWRAALGCAALAVMVGCSTLPTAPRTTSRAAAQGGLLPGGAASRPSAGTQTGAQHQDTTSKVGDPVIGPSDSLEISTIITGIDGGVLQNGSIEVELPAGAIDGTAQISIKVNCLDSKSCELGIVPASANHFAKPVLLTVDCAGLSHLERYGIVWLDESTGEWVDIGSTVDLKESTITAELAHFSQYKVAEVLREGKAGW